MTFPLAGIIFNIMEYSPLEWKIPGAFLRPEKTAVVRHSSNFPVTNIFH